jgi:hypothetical protein
MGPISRLVGGAVLVAVAACGGETPAPQAPTQSAAVPATPPTPTPAPAPAPAPAPTPTPTPAPAPAPAPTPTPTPDHPGPKALPGSGITYGGGDGSSVVKAILIHGARGEMDGTASEYQYIALLYGPQGQHWTTKQQALLNDKGRNFDELDIVHDGKAESFFFDISEYFGKF